jgi:arylsulfatase
MRLHRVQWWSLLAWLVLVAVTGSDAAEPRKDASPPAKAGPSAAAAPGSPAATTTIDGRQLPAPAEPFRGEIGVNARDSKPYWPPTVAPPKSAPNVLLIMTDDVGFGAPSTFGGVIPTPALDRIAAAGLRYTQFHSTALCSPTRAALITGDNHHSTGFGVVAEMSTGFPGYNSIIGRDTATIGRILKENGYATAWFGKDHNVPAFQASQAGPFDLWPSGMGFDYFYGFVGGDTSQWQPNLFRNTTPIYPYLGHPGWNLVTAMADDAVAHIKMLNEVDPKRPFFVYYVPGATHAPHHPTQEWVKKISDQHLFDGGWNKLREQIFANQKRLGVIPRDAELTPWPDDLLKRWETLRPEEQKLFIRQVEVYAAYLAYADHEIGRVIQAIDEMGKLNDTLVIYISGDNGSSPEGSPNGTPNEVAQFNGVEVPVDVQLKNFYDVWGTDKTYNHMAVGWTWALDTPYRWTKQVASHFGGTRQGMAMSWPGHIEEPGGVRNQFHHVIDIVPTILEATGIAAPVVVDGIAQRPMEGVSMAYTFKRGSSSTPGHHRVQYFEMFGNRGMYKDGWYANTTPIGPPWKLAALPDPDVINAYPWELYDLSKDWTQSHNVAAAHPDKLKELQELFMVEAAKHQVFPLDNSLASRMVTPRPSVTAGRNVFTYSGALTGIPMGAAPLLLGTSYTISANVEIPKGGGEGVIATQGGRFGGWGFYLLKGKPVYVWNLLDLQRVRWEGREPLAPGMHTVSFELKYHGLGFATLAFNSSSGIGQGATGILSVDGTPVSTQDMEHTIPTTLQWDESFDIGSDTGTPVDDDDYQVSFAFNGKLSSLAVKVNRPKMTPEEEHHFMQQSQREHHASE